MRKFLLFVLLILIVDLSYSQLIPNGNFENWQVVNHYEVPDNWFIINDIEFANNLVEKSNDAQQASKSVKLNTIATTNDTLFGLVMYGEYNNGIFKGKPYSELGDNFHFFYKSNMSAGDMGMMLMMLYKNGVLLDSVVHIFNASQIYWTEVILPVNPLQTEPDSMFLTFLSSIPEDFGGDPKPGSWLKIDNMFFTLGANPTPITIPNYSFESWSMLSTEEAVPWVSSNTQNNLLINDIVNVSKTNNSNTGIFAAEISTVIVSGIKTVGNIQIDDTINSQPEKLKFSYKYIPDGTDTAFVNIAFYKNQNIVGGGSFEISSANTSFIEYSLLLNFTDIPDEYNISIINGKNPGTLLIIDDIHFECIKPQYFFAEFSSPSTALLNWNSGGQEDEWQIQWGLDGFVLGNGSFVSVSNQTTYNLSSISDINKYDFYIRSVCGAGDTSNWLGPYKLCKSSNVPLFIDFENTPVLEIPSCWHTYYNSSQLFTSNMGYAFEGDNYLYVRINNNAETTIFSSPQLFEDVSQLYISFYGKMPNWALNSQVAVGTMSNPSDPLSFNQVAVFNLNYAYQNYNYFFNNYNGTDTYIAFKFLTNDVNTEIYLDDIIIDVLPTCIPPLNLNVNNITLNTATITWQPGNNETLWHLVYGEEGFDPDIEGTQINNLIITSCNLSSLLSNSSYDVYVKADCGGGLLSTWSKISFTTECGFLDVPVVENMETTSEYMIPSCWHTIVAGSGSVYVVTNGQSTSGANSVKMTWINNNSEAILITPQINNNINQLYIAYKAKTNNISAQPFITVGTIESPSLPNTFTPLYNHYLTSEFLNYEFYFNNYTGSHTYIALKFAGTQQIVTESFVDDVLIDILPACIPPNSFATQNITFNSANLNWQTGNNELLWDIKYGIKDFDVNTQGTLIDDINTNSYLLDGVLTSGTTYDVYLRADCGLGVSSTWIKITFTTLCLPFNVPVSENFDFAAIPDMPLCWYKFESDNAQIQTVDVGESISGVNSLRLFKLIQDTAFFISPEFISDLNALSIIFNAKKANWVNDAGITVGTMTAPDNPSSFNGLYTFNLSNSFQEFTYYFNNYTGNDNYIALKLITNDNSAEVFIDDITIDSLPDCIPPNTLTVLNISDNSAQLLWQAGNNETLWNILYDTTGFDPNTQGINVNGLVTNSYDFNNTLNPNTNYDVYVQADCGSGSLSTWIFKSFKTSCSTFAVPFYEGFENTNPNEIPDCWNSLKTSNTQINVIDLNWYALNGSNSLNIIKQQQDLAIIITPELLPNIQALYLSFHSKKQYYVSDATVVLGTMSNPLDENTFSFVAEFTLENYYQQFEHYFHNHFTTDKYIALKIQTTDNLADIFIDDIHIDSLPSCIPPKNLTADNITDNSAVLSWQIGNFEFLWNLKYGFTGFDPNTQGTLVQGLTTTAYDFNNTLNPSTTYDAYVQADCFGGDLSTWIKVSFSTHCASFSVPIIEDFENILHPDLPVCWKNIDINTTTETGNFSQATSGLNSLKFVLNPGSIAYLISPEIDENISSLYLKFQAKKQMAMNPLTVTVGTMSNSSDMNSFDSLTFFNITDYFSLHEYFFSNYAGNDKYIAFKISGGDPNVQLYFDDIEIGELPSCFTPVNFQVNNITGTSALLTWTQGNNETLWNVLWGESGFDPLTEGNLISGINTTFYDFNNILNSNTSYDVYVQADCGGGDTSAWISDSFTTLCLAYNVAVIEDFETPDASGIPQCWHKITTNWAQVEAADYGNATSGTKSLLIQMAHDDVAMIVTPEILQNLNTLYISFNAKKQAWIPQAAIILGTLTQQDDYNSFVPLKNYNLTDNFKSYDYYFNNYSGSAQFIALKLITDENNAAAFIDDIVIDVLPSCIPPHSLSAENITLNSAELLWQASNTESIWQVEYGFKGFFQGMGILEVVNDTFLVINGLNQGTEYDFYVRAICDIITGDTSQWAGPYSFSTACNVPQTPIIETFEDAFPPVCWHTVAGSGNWALSSSAGGYGNSNYSAIANFYNIHANIPFDLITLEFDATITNKPRLIFDYAYATFINEMDELQILYSSNGGNTYTLLEIMQGGLNGPLNTGGATYNNFVPISSEWANKTIELPAGTNKVNFRAKSSFGNNLYIDNVVICNNYEIVEDIEICTGNTYLWRGQEYNTTGLYYDSLETEFGCDSVFVLNLLVSNYIPVNVSVNAAPSNPVCYGAEVVFTALPSNGGTMPVYEWKINGLTQGTSNATFETNILNDDDTLVCVINSNALCYSGSLTATDTMFMDVITGPVADLSIIATPGTTICEGTEVIFMAQPVNGGTNPIFEWRINGNAVGVNTPVFSCDTLKPNDVINCLMNSNEICVQGSPVFSDALYMTVNPILPVSVTIAANPSYPVCKGTNIIFTANAVNGGTTPVYEWKVNGSVVGSNNPVYECDTLSDNDVVSCVIVSNAQPCAVGSPAISNYITLTIYPLIPVDVSIQTNTGTTVCEGTDVTFIATPVNPGTIPAYQWKINNIDVGTNSNIFSTNNLQNEDVVSCVLISNAFPCASNNPATSNEITMTVNPAFPVDITIDADTLGPVCYGTTINFTATPQNEGNNPVYQWKINNVDVGTNSPLFSCDTLNNSDIVSCQLLSDITTCPINNPATSNTLTVSINPELPVSISIIASPSNIVCDSVLVTFTATAVNPGLSPVYQWKINGIDVGTNSPVFSSNTLSDSDIVSCVLTSSANPCETGNPATSNPIAMQIKPKYFIPLIDSICNGTVYSWRGNNYSVSGNYYDSLLTQSGCDSIYMLNLYVKPTFIQSELISICYGEVYNWHGNNYTLQGTYYDTLQTVLGCDSVFVLNLLTKSKYFFTESVYLCTGDTLSWHGQLLTTTGVFYDSLLTTLGCDSIFEIQLFNIPSYQYITNDTICDGEIFFWRNNNYITQGVYYDSLYTNQGCDSLYILNLFVNPAFQQTDSIVICNGETFSWQGNTYDTQGIYYDTLLTQCGCDSVFTLKLYVTILDVSVSENNATLTANTTAGLYQWIDCDNNFMPINGETSAVFIPTINGNYAVIITKNNCTDTSACYQVDDVFIHEFIQSYIEIYPNPSRGELFLKTNRPIQLTVYNVLGDVLFVNNYNEAFHAIDLKHLHNGVYILNAVGENIYINRKIIIQK